MNKKYQIFISSTFEDLKEERIKIQEAILDLGCIPVCMEYFPAGNVKQFDYIKKQMDMCDYVVMISANEYGSVADDGKSYTEKEYWYAQEKEIPVLAFLNKDFKGEKNCEKVEPLNMFRNELKKSRIVKFWNSTEELKSDVLVSLHKIFDEEPRVGWIRAREVDKYIAPRFCINKDEPENPKEGDIWIALEE